MTLSSRDDSIPTTSLTLIEKILSIEDSNKSSIQIIVILRHDEIIRQTQLKVG